MARKAAEYKAYCYVILEDKTVPFSELTEAEREKMYSAMRERLSTAISDYCNNHPGTFASLPGKVIE